MKLKIFIYVFIGSINSSLALEAPQKVKALENQIKILNSDVSCKTDKNCVALPIGYKACGGPDRYLTSSTSNPQLRDLLVLIENFDRADKKWQQEEGLGSICDITVKPVLKCIEQKCTLNRK